MFSQAYTADAAWAVANLTTWLVWINLASVLVNAVIVYAAFEVQRREFRRRELELQKSRSEVYSQAVSCCRDGLTVYDAIMIDNAQEWDEFSISDVQGRLLIFSSMISHFMGLQISDRIVLNALFSVRSLLDRAISDFDGLKPTDRHQISRLREVAAFRLGFRNGVEKIVKAAEAHKVSDVR